MSEEAEKLFSSELKVINVGLEIFRDDLASQNVKVVQVSFTPPAKIEKEYEDILSKLM
ncbi:MAG TPA: hypothetical protein VMS77_02025 [Conexivisphaerales archaeon]|nr:hypothetical protein [Conexivisphaerales archaeon]